MAPFNRRRRKNYTRFTLHYLPLAHAATLGRAEGRMGSGAAPMTVELRASRGAGGKQIPLRCVSLCHLGHHLAYSAPPLPAHLPTTLYRRIPHLRATATHLSLALARIQPGGYYYHHRLPYTYLPSGTT